MITESRAGKIQTVTGLISPEDLGVTLTHDHLMKDSTSMATPGPEASVRDFYHRPVSAETVGLLRHYADKMVNADDFLLGDVISYFTEQLIAAVAHRQDANKITDLHLSPPHGF